jgi:predicted deacylase
MPAMEPPVEILPPDLGLYRAGNGGIPYVATFDAGRAGPRVTLVALVHGNELSGAWALHRLLERGVRPRRGRLSLAFANIEAFARFDPGEPRASRFVDEDMNRLWSRRVLDSGRDSAELRRARELRPLVEATDFLLDLHSMQQPSAPLILAGTAAKGRRLARAMGYPAFIVADAGHRNGRRLRDYGALGDPARPETAILVEAGQHWARRSVDVAIAACLHFLRAVGCIDAGMAGRLMPNHVSPPQREVEVTDVITADGGTFRFVEDFVGMEVIPKGGTVIAYDGSRPVRTPYDGCVLIMPSQRLGPGLTAVRLGRFVETSAEREAGW